MTAKISVIMPTRNRLHLLRHAVQSVQAQTFRDVEIVLSDNCSEDGTQSWGQSLAQSDARIKYVRAPEPLGMRESWEFAAQHATATHITFLGDDDAFSRDCLSQAWNRMNEHQVPLVVWRYGNYFHPSWPEANRCNSLLLLPFTGEIKVCSAYETLEQAFQTVATVRWPHLSNAIHHRHLLDKVRARLDCLFPSGLGDHFTSTMILRFAEKYVYIDRPMSLYGWWQGSFSSAVMQQNLQAVQRLVSADEKLHGVPMQMRLWSNLFASSLLMVQKYLTENTTGFQLNWTRYFINCFNEIQAVKERGLDVTALEQEFNATLAAQPDEIRTKVQQAFQRQQTKSVRTRLRETINRWPVWFRWEAKLRPKLQKDRAVLLHGKQLGFHNIAECASQMDVWTNPDITRAHQFGFATQGMP